VGREEWGDVVEVHSCREEIPSALWRDGVVDRARDIGEAWKRARIRARKRERVWSTFVSATCAAEILQSR